RFFPQGFAGDDVLREIAPNGWDKSSLLPVFHPSFEQVYDEALRMHRNINSLRRPNDLTPPTPEPTPNEVAKSYCNRPIETEREVCELVAQCLWDVFSDNHEVVAADGRILDLGSFRGSGAYLAELLNRQINAPSYDYMDFYMGTIWVAQRTDLTPVYELIFRRLQSDCLDW